MKEVDVPNGPIEEEKRKFDAIEENRKRNTYWRITRTESINYHSNSEEMEAKNADDKKNIATCGNKNPTDMQNSTGINFAPTNEEDIEEEIMKQNLKRMDKRKPDKIERKVSTTEINEQTKTRNKEIYTASVEYKNDEIQKERYIKSIELERFFENVKKLNQMSTKRNIPTAKTLQENVLQSDGPHLYNKNDKVDDQKKKQLKKFLDAEEDINFFLEYKRMNPNSAAAIREMTPESVTQKEEPTSSSILDNSYTNNVTVNSNHNMNLSSNNEINNINKCLPNVTQINQGNECANTSKVDNAYPDKKGLKRFIRTSKNIRCRLEKIENEIIQHQMKYNREKKVSIKHIQKNAERREQAKDPNLNQYTLFQRMKKFTLDYDKKESANLNKILNHMNENYCKKERMNTVLDSNNIHMLYKELQGDCGNVSQMLDILYDVDTKHNECINMNQQCIYNSKSIPYNLTGKISNENAYQGASKGHIDTSMYDRASKQNYSSLVNHSRNYDKRNYEQFLKKNETHHGMISNPLNHTNLDRRRENGLGKKIHRDEEGRKMLDDLRKRIENYNNSKNNLSMHNGISVPSAKYLNTIFVNRIEEIPNPSEVKMLKTNNISSSKLFKRGLPGPINPIINANLLSEVELQKLKFASAEENITMSTREQTPKQENYKKSCVLKKMSNEARQVEEKGTKFPYQVSNSIYTNILNPTDKNPKELRELNTNMNEDNPGKKESENRKRNRDHETKKRNACVDLINPNDEIENYENVSFKFLQKEVKKNIIRIFREEQLKDHAMPPCKEFHSFPTSNRNYFTIYPVKKKHNSLDNIMQNKISRLINNLSNETNKQGKNQSIANEINENTSSKLQNKNIYSDHSVSLKKNYVVSSSKETLGNECDMFQRKPLKNNPSEEINILVDGIKNTLPSKSTKKMNPLDIIDTTNSLYENMLNIFYEEGYIKNRNTHQLREVHFKTGAVLKTKNHYLSALQSARDNKKIQERETHNKFPNDTTPINKNIQGKDRNQQKYINNESMLHESHNINGNNYKLENREVSRMSTKTSLVSKHVSSDKMNANDQSNKGHKYKENHN